MDEVILSPFEKLRTSGTTAGDAELRETKLEAFKPLDAQRDTLPVVFRGPFSEIKLDSGHVLRRGCVTQLPSNVVDELKNTPLGDLLVVIETATAPVSCTA